MTKIATVTIPEDATSGGNSIAAGIYLVEMPSDYDPALVTWDDIVHDDALRIVEEAASATISRLLDECYAEAVSQGFSGARDEWEPTAEDLEYVVEQIGRKPTRAEWAESGVGGVGPSHCHAP